MFLHDVIKIKYIKEGYLPTYPYHLISDEEMFDAFIRYKEDTEEEGTTISRYFDLNYANPSNDETSKISNCYNDLTSAIKYAINAWLNRDNIVQKYKYEDDKIEEVLAKLSIPDWVYAYMLGNVINTNSDVRDIHDYLVLMHLDNMDDIITPAVYGEAYKISKQFTDNKLYIVEEDGSISERLVVTMFGDANILKVLRVRSETEI